MDQTLLKSLAGKISKTGSLNIYNFAQQACADLIELDNRLKMVEAAPSSAPRYVGVLDLHRDLGYPIDGRDLSNVLYNDLKSYRIPKGVSLMHGPYQNYHYNVDLSTRLDVGWQGVPTGVAGNYSNASERIGSIINPAIDGKPVYNIAPSILSQRGPTFQWIQGFCGAFTSFNTDFITVHNCNNGVIKHVSNTYGASVVTAIDGDDNAYWHLEDIRSIYCKNGILYDANLGWKCFGLIAFMSDGQAALRERNFAQSNCTYGITTDGHWEDPTATTPGIVEGNSVVVETGAHNNEHVIHKLEATNPAVVLTSTGDPSKESPTRSNKFSGNVIGGRYQRTRAFDIGPNVDQTIIDKYITYVDGATAYTDLIKDQGTRTKKPLEAEVLREE